MKSKRILPLLAVFSLAATVAMSQTTLADASGFITDNSVWTGDVGPNPGDTGIWDLNGQSIDVANGTTTFDGGTLVISSGSSLRKNSAIISAATFNLNSLQVDSGGVISSFASGNRAFTLNISGILTLNGGTFEQQTGISSRLININASSVNGSGTVGIGGNGALPANNRKIDFSGSDLSGFTGNFNLTNTGSVQFGEITTGSFGLSLSDNAQLRNDNNVAFTTLTIAGDAIAAGTYAVTDFTVAQQAFFTGTGTITVVPEPSTYAILIGFVVLGLTITRRFKKS